MTIMRRAKIPWYSSSIFSTDCFAGSVSSVSVQSNSSRRFFLDPALSVGFSFSFSFDSFNFLRIDLCFGVRTSVLPEFLRVGNHNGLLCCSGWPVLCSSFRYVVKCGLHPGIILRVAVSTGLLKLDCSGVTTENSAICVIFSDLVRWFVCMSYSDCYFPVIYRWNWVKNRHPRYVSDFFALGSP